MEFCDWELSLGGIQMKMLKGFLFGAALIIVPNMAMAQAVEPTFKADPNVYKVIFEDANFRVIEGTRKAGVKDKAHAHPVAGIVYNVTDCKTKQHTPDGKTTESDRKAGTAFSSPITENHSAENTGSSDCKQIFVEKK